MTGNTLPPAYTTELTVTRREAIAGAVSFVFALTFRPHLAGAAARDVLELTAWIRLGSDNRITIYNPSAEMGQGAMTAMPLIIAEELDADWSRVDVEYSPIVREIYGRPRQGGLSMSTTGSRSLSSFFMPLRRLGAQARRLILDSAAQHWGVPLTELRTEPSVVVHDSSARRLTYGEIASFARLPQELPEIADSELKAVSEFRLIGKPQPRRDVPAKVDGSAKFALDARIPGMCYAMMVRAPIHGSGPAATNADQILSQPGIIDVVLLEHGVGILGENINAVLKARKTLEVRWTSGARADGFDDERAFERFAVTAKDAAATLGNDDATAGRGHIRAGDVADALAHSARAYVAEYRNDHIYHAQMEPLNAVASVSANGEEAEIWIGSQSPDDAGDAVAEALGIQTDRVTVNQHYLGGGFGRRTINDEAVEAALLSKAVRRPVKLIWSREDDVQYGAFRPMSLQRLEAGVDQHGYPVAWRHYVVGDEAGLQTTGVDIPFYDIANKDIRPIPIPTGVRLRHWRAVGHGYNKFAIESFIDEIAADQEIDPLEFRRRLLGNSPRELRVLDTVAGMADWAAPRQAGRALGMAFAERSDSTAAGIVEISVDTSTGKIRVHHFWVAVDAGIVVQPDIAIAQIEGAVTQGVSSALTERISIKSGRVEQSNFHDYRVMTMADSFPITVELMTNEHPPTGIGEAGLPVTGGAIANAFARLTGKRLRHMPFTPDRVKAALSNV